MAMVRRLSRSRKMQRKVQQLQQKFSGLDNVANSPTSW